MGKGDKKSRKGKITMGSYGVTRPRKKAKPVASKTASTTKKETTPKAAAAKKVATKTARPASAKVAKKKDE